jgi:PAS domain S-box-containing protein
MDAMPKNETDPKKRGNRGKPGSQKNRPRPNKIWPGNQGHPFPAAEEEYAFRQAIEDSIISGIAAVDEEGRQTYANPALCKMVGWSREELLGKKPPFPYWPPEEMENITKAFQKVMAGGKQSGSLELRFQRRNGERFDALVLFSTLKDPEGNMKGWVGSISDFTQQKRAEEEIRRLNAELEERVRQRTADLESTARELEEKVAEAREMGEKIAHMASFPEMNPNPVVEIDYDGQVHYQNPAAERLFPDLRTLGTRHSYLAGLDTIPAFFQASKDTSRTMDIQVGPSWYRQTIHYIPQWGRIRIYGFDNTEQKKAEESVKESEKKYRGLYDGSQDGYVRVDMGGKIQEWNTAYREMLGYTGEELGRLTYVDLTPPKWHSLEADIVEKEVLLQGYSRVYEKEYIRKDGTIFPVSLRTYLIKDPKGDSQGMWAFVRDITERKKAGETLRKSNERLKILSDLASRLLETGKPQEVVEDLCRRVMNYLDCQAFFNYLVDEEKQCLYLNAYAGIPAEEARQIEWLNFGVAVCGCAARDGVRIVAENIPETLDPRTDLVRSYGVQAYACHPLLSQGRVIGTLSFGTRTRTAFTEDELSLMKTVADQVSTAMERIRLYEMASKRADELDQMVRERTRDLSERINELDCLCTVSGLLNQEGFIEDILRRTVGVIPSGWQFPEIACARVVLEGREYRTENFRQTPWLQTSAIISKGRQVGILEVAYLEERPGRDEGPFLKEERTLLDALADQVGEFLERNKAHQAVRETNELLEGVFSSINLLIAHMDKDFNFIRVNRAYAEADGRNPEFYMGKNHFTLFPNEENEEIFRRVVETGEPYSVVEKPFTYADHPERGISYWDWSLHPVKEADGRVSGVVLSLVNVTERKQAEEALKRSSLYTRSLIEASLDPLVTISLEGKITDVNRATELVTGVPRERIIGSDFSVYFTDPLKAREGYERVFQMGAVRDYPLAIRHASGKVIDVLYNATVYRTEAGEVQGVFAAARDITERKLAEVALRQNEQLLRNVLELLPVGVWIADKDGVITYGNPAGHRIWAGYRYVGIEQFGEYKGWWLHTGQKIEPEEWAAARAIRKGETSLNEEIEIECFDGSRKIILNSAIPLRNDKNEITGAFIINDDMTERRQTEQRIRQMQKMEALGTLAGGIAHDFNNILMPIIINAELALLDVKQNVLPSPNYMQLVKEAATRGQELVKQIITFSRQREQPRQPVDINPVIKEALKFLRASIPKNIEIRSSIDVEPAMVLADPTQIHQVLMNLCSNAAYAMRGKEGILRVSLTRVEIDSEVGSRQMDVKAGLYLRLSISDTGHGMDPEVRERAFDPFFTTKKPGEGTGMGLAVVHGIVKNHEGAITVESEVGKGTTVHVFLPWVQAGEPQKDVSPEPIPTGKERILLIDDEEIQVRTLQHMLERIGYRVFAKTRAPEALETFRAQPDAFDLVITDQTMPELTGANLAREVLRIRPDMPVILYTGYSETLDEEEARSIGIRDFALKPLTVRDLAERIRRALKK